MQHPLNMFLIIIGENNHQKYFSTAQYNSSLYSLIISLGVFHIGLAPEHQWPHSPLDLV